jgi:HME family heavy-metal exporter
MVGFISLAGIASRNGILLLNHYLHLVKYEGEGWTKEMIVRAGLERLAPVLMTALTSGVGLVPLVWAAGDPGKEILYPVATVILGGLMSCTLLDFCVRPASFWLFSLRAAEQVVKASQKEIELVEETAGGIGPQPIGRSTQPRSRLDAAADVRHESASTGNRG